jgi:hypothetical protein
MFDAFGQVEKRRTFNRTFWLGFMFGSGIFTLINIASYLIEVARRQGYLEKRIISFSPARGYDFGFPWYWNGDANGVSNLLVFMLFGFACGLAARYLHLVPKIGPMK